MRETFRLSMAYIHTWLGLVLGFVLMICFFFGSLSVFDREIDQWSVPETRAQAAPLPSFDRIIQPLISQIQPDPESVEHAAAEVFGPLPATRDLPLADVYVGTNHRDPLIRLYGTYDVPNKPKNAAVDHVHIYGYAAINPQTGERLPTELEERLALGTGFFFPLHFMLHLEWKDLGIWIVGLAGIAMLVALISGVVIHRRIFREFFTFRPEKARLRSVLDLHNMTGVLALPFLFVITLSGLLIFAGFYLPSIDRLMKPTVDAQLAVESDRTGLSLEAAGRPGGLASVDRMMAEAEARWAAQGVPGRVGYVQVIHLGDANGYVSIGRDNVDRVATAEALHFDADTGRLIYENPPTPVIEAVHGFLYGLHFQFFKHWLLRWLLFAGGLIGCACIATGFLFFVEKRKKKHAATNSQGARIVDSLAVAAVTGMLVATTSLLLANRLLPTGIPSHDTWQTSIFWLVWLATLGHALLRSGPVATGGVSSAWAEQAWAAAALAVAAVVANWVTTGDHLIATIGAGYWPVAGVDLVLLGGAVAAGLTARRLGRRAAGPTAPKARRGSKPDAVHV